MSCQDPERCLKLERIHSAVTGTRYESMGRSALAAESRSTAIQILLIFPLTRTEYTLPRGRFYPDTRRGSSHSLHLESTHSNFSYLVNGTIHYCAELGSGLPFWTLTLHIILIPLLPEERADRQRFLVAFHEQSNTYKVDGGN